MAAFISQAPQVQLLWNLVLHFKDFSPSKQFLSTSQKELKLNKTKLLPILNIFTKTFDTFDTALFVFELQHTQNNNNNNKTDFFQILALQ